jgi:hypothetical protein
MPSWYNKGATLGKLGLTAESNEAFAKAKELGSSSACNL